jgi:uncharacterized protein (TIRG00374 family)
MLNIKNYLPKISVAIAFLFLGFIFYKDRNDFHELILKANYAYFPYIIIFSIGAICLSGVGYWLVADLFSIKVPFRKLFPIGVFTIVINNLMAFGGVAGFALRIFMLKKYKIQAKHVLASSFFHMYIYTIGITAFVPFSLLYIFRNYNLPENQHDILLFASIVSFAVFVVISLILLVSKFRRKILKALVILGNMFFSKDLKNEFNNFDLVISKGINSAKKNKLSLPLIFLITLADYSSASLAFYYCFKSLGVNLSNLDVFSGLVIASSAGILSMIPGGIGVQEASGAQVFKVMGVPFQAGFLASLLFRVIFFIAPFIFAVFFLLRYKFGHGEGVTNNAKDI